MTDFDALRLLLSKITALAHVTAGPRTAGTAEQVQSLRQDLTLLCAVLAVWPDCPRCIVTNAARPVSLDKELDA